MKVVSFLNPRPKCLYRYFLTLLIEAYGYGLHIGDKKNKAPQ